MQRLDLVGVAQLQQLHSPLDVGQAAATQFGVRGRIGSAREPFGIDARLDAPDLAHRRVTDAAFGVAGLVDHVQEPQSQFRVTGNRMRT
ncbi:hypothetical protein GCM10020255_089490 [Rhodococcus baikonurensis]